MTSAQKAAHLRLLEQPLPRRTHYRQLAAEPNQGRRYGAELPPPLIDEYRALKSRGFTYTDIRPMLGIGSKTMRRIIDFLKSSK
jgi:hypothetical protein